MKKFLSVLLLAVMCVCGALGLTACDLEKQPINVVFIVNDSTYSATKMYDPATVKAPSDPVLTGYAFDGWFLDKDVWEQPYDATAVISESVNVYAKLHTVHVHDIKTEVIAPTCTEKGYTRHYCDCGEIDYNDRITYALGHNFGNWEITTAPTCIEKGEETRTCSRCGEKETRDLEALGHSFGNWEITTAPTCTEKGEETRTCSRCQEVEKRDIQETGHSPMKAVKENEVPATCTEKGSYDLVVYCSVCNEELSREGQEVEARGHNYGDLVAEKPVKACTESGETDGFKAHYKCSTCGAYFDTDKNPVNAEDLVIATEHNYKVTTVLPKCTEQGYDVHECQDCHKIIKDNFVDALGHDFEGAVYVSDDNATFEADGTETALCKRDLCDGKDIRVAEGSKLKIKLATLDLKIDSNATDKYLATGVVNSDVLAFGLNAEIVNKDEDVTFKVCTANDAEKEIDGDSVALVTGDNTYYILIYVNEELDSYYKVVIHRNKLITVTFDAKGGSWGDKTLIKVDVEEGDKVSAPVDDPARDGGYSFVTWAVGGVAFDFDAPVTANTTIKALWDQYLFTVAKNVNLAGEVKVTNGDAVLGTTSPVTAGETVTVEVTSTTAGFTFVGWYNGNVLLSANEKYDFEMPAESVTYTAKWTRFEFVVGVNDSKAGTVNNDNERYISAGETVTVSVNTNEGYTFLGWYYNDVCLSSKEILEFVMPSENVTFTAKWAHYKFVTNKNINKAGEIVNDNAEFIVAGDEVTIGVAKTSVGYTFLGWYNGETKLTSNEEYKFNMPKASVTYTAKWQPNQDTKYTVNYYIQNTDGTYTLDNPVVKQGTTDNVVYQSADAVYPHYVFNSALSTTHGTVKGDGSLVLNFFYDIQKVSVLIGVVGDGVTLKVDGVAIDEYDAITFTPFENDGVKWYMAEVAYGSLVPNVTAEAESGVVWSTMTKSGEYVAFDTVDTVAAFIAYDAVNYKVVKA